MGANNKICPNCGRKMKQQFIGLQHCKCGMSWKKDEGFLERAPDMVFALERQTIGKKVKQIPVICINVTMPVLLKETDWGFLLRKNW